MRTTSITNSSAPMPTTDLAIASHRDLGLDVRVRIVAFEHEILVPEGEKVGDRRIEPHERQPARCARKLEPRLFEVIHIEMGIPEGMDEVARLEPGHLRDHHGE